MNKSLKQISLLMLIGLLVMVIFFTNNQRRDPKVIRYSKFLELVKEKKIAKLTIKNDEKIIGFYKDSPAREKQMPGIGCNQQKEQYDFQLIKPAHPELITLLVENGVDFTAEKEDESVIVRIIFNFLPFILIFGLIWFFMIRQIQSTGNKAISFGKSRAKLHPDSKQKVTFADVAGVEEAKEELGEVVDFLKDPKKFINIGARIPKGVLLMGPPGTGKTLLARAIAGETGVPFFSISGSDFVEMFVGVGASRVRDLFEQGKKNAPCIVFIDEIDAVGRLRGAGLGGGHDEREQTLNQLLVEMDGFEANEGVIIIAATNRPDVLDPALLRPGRFDRRVIVDAPDIRGREKILAVHTRKLPLSREVDLKIIARGTPGFTGADLANLANEAALLTARRNKKRISMSEMEEAKDKVLMGPERRSRILTDDDKRITAYHESGHAIVNLMLEKIDPIHKATIIPRGHALGMVMRLPTEDLLHRTKTYWLNTIKLGVAGYLAEKIVFKDVSTGAQNDIQTITNTARKMVCEWGMSDELGLVSYSNENEQIFLGREISQHRDYSEETARKIDHEVNDIISRCSKETYDLIMEHYDKFETIAESLLERETLTSEELLMIKNGEQLPPLDVNNNGEKKKQS